jgi:hypothetical protein
VLVESIRHTRRPFERRQFGAVTRFDALDASLHFTHRVEVIRHDSAIARAERGLQLREVRHDRVENALVALRLRDPLLLRPAISKQPLEDDARIVLGRQRCGV